MPHLDLMDPVRAGLAQQGIVAATFDLGRLEESAALSEASLQRLGSPESAPGAWAAIAACYTHALVGLGRWERASELVDGALRVPAVIRQPGYRTWLNSWKGLLAVWRGDIDTAESVAADTDAIFGTTGFEEWTVWFGFAANWPQQPTNPFKFATPLAGVDPTELVTLSETVVWLLILAARIEADIAATARTLRDDHALAASSRAVDQLRLVADQIYYPGPLGAACRAHLLAELSRWTGSSDPTPWREALDAWTPIGFPHEQGWTHLRLAELHAEHDDQAAATEEARQAAALAQQLGAALLAAEAESLPGGHAFPSNRRSRRARSQPWARTPLLSLVSPSAK